MRNTLRLIFILGMLAALAGCAPTGADAEPFLTPTTEPRAAISGVLLPSGSSNGVAGREVGLCRIDITSSFLPFPCDLLPQTVLTDEQGRFRFDDLNPWSYAVVYAIDTDGEGLSGWVGETLHPGDLTWLRETFLSVDEGAHVNVWTPASLPADVAIDRGWYGSLTLMLEGSPLVIGHEIHKANGVAETTWVTVMPEAGTTASVTLPLLLPDPPDLEAVRAEIGPLTRSELPLLDRGLSERWGRFVDGDDAAYQDTDALVIRALRSGDVRRIGGTLLTPIEEIEGRWAKAVGYLHIDLQSGDDEVVGWYDPVTGDVFEMRTGYRLNVRDDTGVWVEAGEGGQQFYHYGWSYYPRWGQLLPDPIVALVNDFYGEGSAHMWRRAAQYQDVKRSFGGDLLLLEWDNRTLDRIQAWVPVTAPFVRLPDSGVVDINRDRFLEAVVAGHVRVDEDSVDAFLQSDTARNGSFTEALDRQTVIDALLIPYRSGHLYTDLEAAIILDATFGGSADEPLNIVISDRLTQGFQVPRYRDKVVFVSGDEVANVLLGYPGALNSRWPHEMGHIVDFRSEQYTFTGRPPQGSRCEPVKYLMEYMWWVRRYPGDAPDWDWMPINSGLTLARLLTDEYHNSGC